MVGYPKSKYIAKPYWGTRLEKLTAGNWSLTRMTLLLTPSGAIKPRFMVKSYRRETSTVTVSMVEAITAQRSLTCRRRLLIGVGSCCCPVTPRKALRQRLWLWVWDYNARPCRQTLLVRKSATRGAPKVPSALFPKFGRQSQILLEMGRWWKPYHWWRFAKGSQQVSKPSR